VRQIFVALALFAALGVLGTSSAQAGVTCKVIATLCPPEPAHDGDRDRDHGPKPVPEPGTLALLAAGAGAVGAALRRRRNKS
jgi:PEP-CTERM motif